MPSEGPPALPVRHWSVELHQPQLMTAVHAAHVVFARQGSMSAGHMDRVHAQLAQVPAEGPVTLPVSHVAFDSHQPQPSRAMHPSHEVVVVQGSTPQLIGDQSQVGHDPSAGPAAVPEAHADVLAHQPQPLREAQSPHVIDE